MNELEGYVDRLFAKYKRSPRTRDLKAEIVANLEAKREDLAASGLSEAEAVRRAEADIPDVDFLFDGERRVYYTRMKLEALQRILIAVLTGWIVTIPMLLFGIGTLANAVFFLAVVALGLYYLLFRRNNARSAAPKAETRRVSAAAFRKREKITWTLWAAFLAVCLAAVTALRFGSALWFSEKVRIDGPYSLAVLLISYAIPLLTAVVPVSVAIPRKLIPKYEVPEDEA